MQRVDRSPRNLTTIERVARGGMGVGLVMTAGAVADMPYSVSKINSAEKAILVQFPVDTAARDKASAVVSSFQQQIDQAVADGNPNAMIVLATSEQLRAVREAKSDLAVVAGQQTAQNDALDTDSRFSRFRRDMALAAGGLMVFFGSNHLRREEADIRKEAAARKEAANPKS